MASRHEIADYPAPWFGDLPPRSEWRVVYDGHSDILYLHLGAPLAAVLVDSESGVWIRIDPETGQVRGLEIEDLERHFLPNHADLRDTWAKQKRTEAVLWAEKLMLYVREYRDGNAEPVPEGI